EWPEPAHQPAPVAAVITESIEVEREARRRVGADKEPNRVARPGAGMRAVALDPGTAVFGCRVDARAREHPVARPGSGIFFADAVGRCVISHYRGQPGNRQSAGTSALLQRFASRDRRWFHDVELPVLEQRLAVIASGHGAAAG